ncbi:hypothetical protein F383_06635 [Gossypium arboreum]
MLFET